MELDQSAGQKTRLVVFNLPTAPPKPSDKRAFHGSTCQAEALATNDLADIVRNAIEQRFDQAVLDRELKREKRERVKLRRLLDRR